MTGNANAVAQGTDIVINEIVAANDSYVDNYGVTPDWIELQNNGSAANLAGWTISDSDGNEWVFPSVPLGPGERVVIFASTRDETSPRLHTNFSLKRLGETVSLSDPNGSLVDEITFPALGDDQAYGRDLSGAIGFLASPTPEQSNADLAPTQVTILTPPQAFVGSLSIEMSAPLGPAEEIRYTTDGTPVTPTSQFYNGPFTVATSTVVRAAVVTPAEISPETSTGYIAVSSTIANTSSDIPLVLVHSTGTVGTSDQDAVVTIIDRDPATGRAAVLGEADYTGFAGLRIRGATSANFAKKQYKFETWGDRLGTEADAEFLDLGADSDWVLYAPGRYDRAMINNPFMYELGKRIGVVAPDYQFVELYLEDNPSATVGDGDYLGLYVLRENIKIGDTRVDITPHTPTTAGDQGGYIVRYDWNDSCCSNIEAHPDFGSYIEVDQPGAADITSAQFDYISDWWNDLQDAAQDDYEAVDPYIDFTTFIDAWLLEILAMDVDVLRASHYVHLDVGGKLMGGPLWDYDRSMGAADSRVNDVNEAESWKPNGTSGHSYQSDIYDDLWDIPEVQAILRARWAELRTTHLSDAALSALIDSMGAEIAEAYTREAVIWDGSGYGARYPGGLNGELDHMDDWVMARTAWLDAQFLSGGSPPTVTNPGSQTTDENVAYSLQVQATDSSAMVYSATGLPEGLSIATTTGLISGTVAYGDGGVYSVTVLVTDSSGASSSAVFALEVATPPSSPPAVLVNEYNAVSAGKTLANGGSDSTFGQVTGNGGDWFEIVTLDDNLDMRGWRFDLWSDGGSGAIVQTASLVLGQDTLLDGLRAGSIITVAESVPDDLSYNPAGDDWTLQFRSNAAGAGAMFVAQDNFDTNHRKFRVVIRDASGTIRAAVAGETEPWDDANLGVSSQEVFVLAADPSATVDRVSDYIDHTQSTFGSPNTVGGFIQDFSALRPDVGLPGDVDCDDSRTVNDALVILQFSVGTRTDSGGCPTGSGELNAAAADVDNSGGVTVNDALTVLQCAVGQSNDLCP